MCGMSRKSNCWNNAIVESFFATLKDEVKIFDVLIEIQKNCCAIFGCGSRRITTRNDAIPLLAIALQWPLRSDMCNMFNKCLLRRETYPWNWGNPLMHRISVPAAKSLFSTVLAQVDAGEEIHLTRRGVAIARIVAEPARLCSGFDLE